MGRDRRRLGFGDYVEQLGPLLVALGLILILVLIFIGEHSGTP